MLGSYITSDYPITIVIISLIIIVVPLLSPYCYYFAPWNPSIVIFVPQSRKMSHDNYRGHSLPKIDHLAIIY